MANDLYTGNNSHLLRAKKGSMTAWRNADAVLTSAEVVATNELIAGRLYEPNAIATPMGTGSTYLGKWKTTGYSEGTWEELSYFQTDFDLYEAMGTCVTQDDTPAASYYTHTHALRTGQDPTWQGRHLERENPTDAESERLDLLGMMLQSLHIECSQASQVATQHAIWRVARVLNKTDDTTNDIARAELTDRPYRWEDFSFTFTYNSNAVEATPIGWALDIQNNCRFTGMDSDGYFTIGKYKPLTFITVTLEVDPYGLNLFELIRKKIESYAGDLNLTATAVQTTNQKQITFTHEKLYCQPFVLNTERRDGFHERYLVVMSQMDTGSLIPVSINTYDDDYYET